MFKSSTERSGNYPRKKILLPFVPLVLILTFTALACDLNDIFGGKPNAIISSPPSGSTFHEGEDIAVQSVSTDSKGIVRVELLVDGQVVRTDTAPSPQDQFTLIQTWKATQGSHTVLVRAYNTQNVGSDPAAISIQVSPAVAGAQPTTAPGIPSITPAPGIPSITPAPGGCTNNSAFVSDVTVPDGATIAGGQTFNKIWRLSNNGTCAWSAGYQFVFVSGEAMSPNTVIAVPSTAPGATADLLVPMTAPGAAGSHSGSWRLRSSGGILFGTIVTVKITVPGALPPPTNTSAPTGCSGNPVITSFTAAPNPITAGTTVTLTWGAVTNADSVDINQGIGGVGTPGSTTVTPGTTTTYTMTAHCGSNVTTSSVTVTVNPAINFGGHWDTNFGPMDLTQTGSSVTGTYSHYGGGCTGGTINGTVAGSTLDGTWGNCGSGSIHFVMAGGGNRWDGNWGGSNKWCAARSGVALASGCGFSGHWNLNTNGTSETAELTQIGSAVTGSYTKGTISGTVTAWTLNGTWNIASPPASGSFVWIIDSAGNLFFKGNYGGSTFWCGWRDGQPAIPNGSCHN